jgi:uncharacterized membrane protein (DUF2068 family)
MDLTTPILGRYVRIVAIISLLVGLADASRLLGVSTGDANPIEIMGTVGFVYLSIFAAARLFAAVGLWIRASWGAVLLLAASAIELGMYFFGNRAIQLSALDFAVRLVLLVAIVGIFVAAFRFRQRAHD